MTEVNVFLCFLFQENLAHAKDSYKNLDLLAKRGEWFSD